MRFFKAPCLVLLGLFVLSFSAPVSAEIPNVKELERQTILYRLAHTKCGFVRMRVSNEVHPSQQTEFLYELTFDENRIQQIRQCRLLGKERWGKPEKLVITPKFYINDIEYLDTPVQIASPKNYDNPREHFGVLNPRILGMVRGGASLLHILDIEDLLNRSDPLTAKVHRARHEEASAWRIDYYRSRKEGSDASIWIRPDQGFSVVRIELRFDQNGKKLVETIVSQLKQYPDKGIWYPERVVKTDTSDGEVTSKEVVQVEDARFGEKIDDTAFSMTALSLEPGRPVVDSTSGLPWGKVWNGREAVDPSDVQAEPANPDHRRWLLWVLAVGLALMAVFYFRRVIQQRRSEPKARA